MNVDITAEDMEALPLKQTNKKKIHVCKHPHCGLKGHATTRSKKCKANPKRLEKEGTTAACAAAVAAAAVSPVVPVVPAIAAVAALPAPIQIDNNSGAPEQSNNDADDMDDMDALPFDPQSDSSADMLHETATWSEDEDGNITNGAFEL